MNGLLSLVIAYLIGSVPFGFLMVKFTTGKDVRDAGSGNIGATNVLRTTGRVAGVVTLLLDIAKGYAAVWIAAMLTESQGTNAVIEWTAIAALAVMAGHAFPVFLKFQGGKAVASFIGAFLYVAPLALLAVLLVFVVVVAATRHISAGSVIAAGSFPLAVWLILHPAPIVLLSAVIAGGFIVYRHKPNLERLRSGTENVFPLETPLKLAIIGAGSWGTALSMVLAPRFESVSLWVYEADLAKRLQVTRENEVYLPGLQLPATVQVSSDLSDVLADAAFVLGVMPSRHARRMYTAMLPSLAASTVVVSATKGLEDRTLLRMSQVIEDVTAPRFSAQVAVLSGPTFAREIASGEPAAVVVAARDLEIAARVQAAFSGPTLRLYTNRDPIGVEVGAALKNIIAIGAGVCQGLGLGNNTRAALITRGLAEISRLAIAMGGEAQTLAGLAGLGDLVLTCSGDLSRNRRVGIELAKGRKLEDIIGSMAMVAEGVETVDAAMELGAKCSVDLPIIQQMHAVLRLGKQPREAVRDLMDRSLKGE